jgi:DNA invertase Pin-like site-specific DNA recombinase
MRVAIYLRVSTANQSTDSQASELREYCSRRGWNNPTEFSDVSSGAKFTRSGLDAMMKEIRKGRIDAVVCYKLDRLGRSLSHLAQLLAEFTNNKTALVVPGQGIDTTSTNPAAQLQLNILASVAEFERSIIRDRVNSGLKAAKERGVILGRPRSHDKHMPAIRALMAQGRGVSAIARELGLALSTTHKLMARAKTLAAA